VPPRPRRRLLEPFKVGLSAAQAEAWPHTDPLDVNGPGSVPERDKGWHTSPRDHRADETDRRLLGLHFSDRRAVREWLLEEEARMGPLADSDLVFVLRRRARVDYARLRQAVWVDQEGNVVHPSTSQLRRHPRRGRGERSIAELGWHLRSGSQWEAFYQVGIYNAS
jgi:hypothetical protein